MSAQVEQAGQSVVATQTQISKDQAWLEVFQERLASDEAINRGSVDVGRHSSAGASVADSVRVDK